MDKKKILIIDDEQAILNMYSSALGDFEVITADNGEEGIIVARKEKPDLIILDLMLPKLDGYKVCRLLKFDERYKHIPILMLTAKTQEKDKILGKETGADEYITKPFEMDSLMEKVKAYLSK